MPWDVFISHATEDKDSVVMPLAEALQARGVSVWLDRFVLRVGDSLRQKIDEGLADSRYGVVIVSRDFMAKDWPQKELDGLIARENNREKIVLPVWHNVRREDVAAYSPILASKYAATTQHGIEAVADAIVEAMDGDTPPAAAPQPTNRVQLTIAYQRGVQRSDEHRYQLVCDAVLQMPPALNGFRWEFSWPHGVQVVSSSGLHRAEDAVIDGRRYSQYSIDVRRVLYPGQRLRIVGEDSIFMYSFTFDTLLHVEREDMMVMWRLMLPDEMPIAGRISMGALHEF